ncbi:DNA/RNA non-specific endonuclease [Mycetocola zhadangensis]|uniref:DNA/RNA non-specific endonuclease n=1 Tax=Mycetocola zhadangensis TaxID=1164595 RepID=UPI003A4D7886
MSPVTNSPENADAIPGYDPGFLTVGVPLPLPGAGRNLEVLDYTHFTVQLDPDRRLAAATAVNIGGGSLVEIERGDDWHLDPRIEQDHQAGPELYARNDLDRGHLVRRRDPVWGAVDVAERANFDSFTFTNAAPQANTFNQSKLLWSGLEDYILEHARVHELNLTVFTGPVLKSDDPSYRGIQIPLAFWKVAVWATGSGALAATAYFLDQRPSLDDIDLNEAFLLATATEQAPPLGEFRTFQVPIRDIEQLATLSFGPAAEADRFAQRDVLEGESKRWVELEVQEDIRL